MSTILVDLLKAGGLAALSVGAMFLLYRGMIQLGVVPTLTQWQGFSLLCLLAILVFLTVILSISRGGNPPVDGGKILGELTPDQHFQLDSEQGIFCDKNNVRDQFISYFDYVDINLSKCLKYNDSRSRAYRIDYSTTVSQSIIHPERRNYRQCFASDLTDKAPIVVKAIDGFFDANRSKVPCSHSASVIRVITVSYDDIRNDAKRAAFIQVFNQADSLKYEIRPVPAVNLAQSDQMESLALKSNQEFDSSALLSAVREFRYEGIPIQ